MAKKLAAKKKTFFANSVLQGTETAFFLKRSIDTTLFSVVDAILAPNVKGRD